MKIFINRKPVVGPWGGGSKVLSAIIRCLQNSGHDVIYDLRAVDGSKIPDIDVLFCVDPRQGSDRGQCGYREMYQYAHGSVAVRAPEERVKRSFILQRVGDVGTHGKPDLMSMVVSSVLHSDTVVFPSVWAHDFVYHSLAMVDRRPARQWHIIPNAPLQVFFKGRLHRDSVPRSISFVSHHWSTNEMKGFGFYRQLESWVKDHGHSFKFIGRLPDHTRLDCASNPMTEHELADELPKHHVYVTASLREAGANHVLEAIAAGLPVIYSHDGGSINEYCAQYGTSFDGSIESFEKAVSHITALYPKFCRNIMKYRTTMDDQALKYVQVMEGLVRG